MTRLRLDCSMLAVLAGLSASVLASGTAVAAGTGNAAPGVSVQMDEAVVVTLRKPAKTVVVGNAMIADATVVDPTHVVVLGRAFGTTNVVALDDAGKQILNSMVTVSDRPGVRITLQRGPIKSTLACTTVRCEAAPTPGDDAATFFAPNHEEIDKRQSLSLKSAEQ